MHPSDRIDSPLQEANLLKSRPECMACRSLRFQILRRISACSPRFPAFLHLELVLLKDAHAAACSSRTFHRKTTVVHVKVDEMAQIAQGFCSKGH